MRCRKFDFEDERKLAKVFQSRALHCATLPVERIEGPSGVKEPRATNQFQVHAEGAPLAESFLQPRGLRELLLHLPGLRPCLIVSLVLKAYIFLQ